MDYSANKEQAETFLKNIRSQRKDTEDQLEALRNAEQQIIGRIQLLDELMTADNASVDASVVPE